MSKSGEKTAQRISAIAEALIPAAREMAVLMGGSPTEGSVAIVRAHALEVSRMAHETAAAVGGRDVAAIDAEAVDLDARVIFARFSELSATYFRDRLGEGGGDVFDETADMAKSTAARVESKT